MGKQDKKSNKGFTIFKDQAQIWLQMLKFPDELGELFHAICTHELYRGTDKDVKPDFSDRTVTMAYLEYVANSDRLYEDNEALSVIRSDSGHKGGIKSGETRRAQSEARKQNEANEANALINEAKGSILDSTTLDDTLIDNTLQNETDTLAIGSQSVYDGSMHNVRLSPEQYNNLAAEFIRPEDLIDAVSVWIPNAKNPPKDHYAMCLKFATREPDKYPKKRWYHKTEYSL